MNRTQYWKEVGEHFGYPECCINEFLNLEHINHPTNIPNVHKNNGFIPCEKHRQDILDNKITLESLISNRKHFQPFPKDSIKDEGFIKIYNKFN